MNTLQLLPFYELGDREFSFVNNIWCRQFPDLMDSDLYNLLPNPDKNDEADPDMMFINPHSDYFGLYKVNNALNNSQGKGISLFQPEYQPFLRGRGSGIQNLDVSLIG